MSTTLAISTCGPQLEVALQTAGSKTPSLIRLAGISPRSTLLLAAVELLVEDAGLERSAIDRVVVSRGPGSFTGIRAGLATAAGLSTATGAESAAYDSLIAQAARAGEQGSVWAAQPGRRGEVYARLFHVGTGGPPEPAGEIAILKIEELHQKSPWLAAENHDLGEVDRMPASRSMAEALLLLVELGAPTQPMEPLYVEGPPVSGAELHG
jgi:tRNA threonylcarbamoyl adenosine modification protein YeaZ